MLRDIYCHLVKMHLKTRHAHIITIDTDYTLHRELGNQYDGYEEMVHDLGERFVVIGEEVPAPAECMLMDTVRQIVAKSFAMIPKYSRP